ncbi:head-tail connector protein [Telmatobacter bradus]|uniref:head-tail connector protein n=1 Tax=Telmatobacter bradus TaxID=474953 RepID=UPI003B43C400
MTSGSAVLTSSFRFLQRDVGAVITVPTAGAASGGGAVSALTASIASVDENGVATLSEEAVNNTGAQVTNFGTMPQSVVAAIMILTAHWYENRNPDAQDIPQGVKSLLAPWRDLRF